MTSKECSREIADMNQQTALGPSMIQAYALKDGTDNLVSPLTYIFGVLNVKIVFPISLNWRTLHQFTKKTVWRIQSSIDQYLILLIHLKNH